MFLEFDIRIFAPWQNRAGVAGLGNGGFNKGGVVPAAVEPVLNPEAACCAKVTRPLGIDLAFKVERALFVGEVTRYDEKGEAEPKSKSVDG